MIHDMRQEIDTVHLQGNQVLHPRLLPLLGHHHLPLLPQDLLHVHTLEVEVQRDPLGIRHPVIHAPMIRLEVLDMSLLLEDMILLHQGDLV